MKKITKLTPEQQSQLQPFHNRWFKVGTCTDRADRVRAEAAIMAMRAEIGVTTKPVFVWCESPATSLLALHFLKSPEFRKWADAAPTEIAGDLGSSLRSSLESSLWSSLGSSLWSSLRSSLESSLWSSLGSSLRSSLRSSLESSLRSSLRSSLESSLRSSLESSLWSSLRSSLRSSLGSLASELGNEWWGQHESYWIAFYLFCRDIVGVVFDTQSSRQLDMWRDIAESTCWWWCYENYVVISERPTVVKMENGRIHAASGPCVAFADGYELHAWRGTVVPKEWIESPKSVDPRTVLTWPNVEQRRAAAEIIGWGRVVEALQPRVIDTDADPMIGELLEVDLPDSPGERFLRVRCGTGRDFVLPVDPKCKTALAANAWTYDVEDLMQFRNYAVRT